MAREPNVALLMTASGSQINLSWLCRHISNSFTVILSKKKCSIKKKFWFYNFYYVNYFGCFNFEEESSERTSLFKFITHPLECAVNEVELSYTRAALRKQLTFYLYDFSHSLELRVCVWTMKLCNDFLNNIVQANLVKSII